jgi:hypothetical protein
MKFTDMLIHKEITEKIVESQNSVDAVDTVAIIEAAKAEDILRKAGYKIKLITGTSFGTQIDLFKQPDEDDIKDVLKDFNIKIKNKQLFIVL